MHQLGVTPAQQLLAALLPFLAVAGEGNAALIDVGTGLLQCQRQAIKLLGKIPRCRWIAGFLLSAAGGALHQELCRRLGAEHLQRQPLYHRTPLAQAGGEQQLAAADLGKQGFHRLGCCFVVDAIEDQQPARMGTQPAEHRLPLDRFFCGYLLRQIEHRSQAGQAAVQGLRGTGWDKHHGAVQGGVAPGMLDRQPGFAHTAQADQRHRLARGSGAAGDGAELLLERLEVVVAALEQLAQGRIGQGGWWADLAGGGAQLQKQRALDLPGELVDAVEVHLRIGLKGAQPRQVPLLQNLLFRISCETFLPRGTGAGNADQ